jgi:hypothetical protein
MCTLLKNDYRTLRTMISLIPVVPMNRRANAVNRGRRCLASRGFSAAAPAGPCGGTHGHQVLPAAFIFWKEVLKMTNEKCYALYLRSVTKNGNKMKAQLYTTFQYKLQQDFGAPIRIYLDMGYSGDTIRRPYFAKLIQDIEAGDICTVVVTDLHRIAGMPGLLLAFKDICDEHEVQILDISHPDSGMDMLAVMGHITEWMRLRSEKAKNQRTGARASVSGKV